MRIFVQKLESKTKGGSIHDKNTGKKNLSTLTNLVLNKDDNRNLGYPINYGENLNKDILEEQIIFMSQKLNELCKLNPDQFFDNLGGNENLEDISAKIQKRSNDIDWLIALFK